MRQHAQPNPAALLRVKLGGEVAAARHRAAFTSGTSSDGGDADGDAAAVNDDDDDAGDDDDMGLVLLPLLQLLPLLLAMRLPTVPQSSGNQ